MHNEVSSEENYMKKRNVSIAPLVNNSLSCTCYCFEEVYVKQSLQDNHTGTGLFIFPRRPSRGGFLQQEMNGAVVLAAQIRAKPGSLHSNGICVTSGSIPLSLRICLGVSFSSLMTITYIHGAIK